MQFIKITECFFVHYNIVQKLKNKIKKHFTKQKKYGIILKVTNLLQKLIHLKLR